MFKTAAKFTGKWAAIITLLSFIPSPIAMWNSAHEWWTAPTQLQLGDWVHVNVFDTGHATSESVTICPKSGSTEFTVKKAQPLWEDRGFWCNGTRWKIRGYAFEDGSHTPLPVGNWTLPERDVEVVRM